MSSSLLKRLQKRKKGEEIKNKSPDYNKAKEIISSGVDLEIDQQLSIISKAQREAFVSKSEAQKILDSLTKSKREEEKKKKEEEKEQKKLREREEKRKREEEVKEEEKQKYRESVDAQLFFSKLGVAESFYIKYPFYYDSSKIWWVWNEKEKKWMIVDEIDILNMISSNQQINIIDSKERSEILNALKQVGRKHKPLEPKPTWIQFRDVIVDIETGEKYGADHRYLITSPIPWKLGESKETPNIDRIFEEWVGKEYVLTLKEIMAYCLLNDLPIHRFFVLYGSGSNGKGAYLGITLKFLGQPNCTSTELDTLLNSRFEVARLYLKRACLIGETNLNALEKTALLKKLTGGDLIGFEFKNKMPFEARSTCKLLISTNSLPPTLDKTSGFYRRVLIIDFPNSFPEQKNILTEIPDSEYENLSSQLVDVLRDLLKKRIFHNEGDIEARRRKYEEKSNPFEKFFKEFLDDSDPNEFITKSKFKKQFEDWCHENRYRTFSDQTLNALMKEKNIESGAKKVEITDEQGIRKSVTAKTWMGIKWAEKGEKKEKVTEVTENTVYPGQSHNVKKTPTTVNSVTAVTSPNSFLNDEDNEK